MCNTKNKRITIRLCEQDYNYLVSKSADSDIPIAQVIRLLIKNDIKNWKEGNTNHG